MNRVYVEESRLPNLVYFFVGLFTIPIWGYFLWGLFKQLVLGESFGNQPMSDNGLILFTCLFTIFTFLIGWMFSSMKLSLKLADGRIEYRFPPFINKVRILQPSDISSLSVEKRSFIKTGLGLRFDFITKATIYATGSNTFLVARLQTGKSLLFSTTNPSALIEIIKNIESQRDE